MLVFNKQAVRNSIFIALFCFLTCSVSNANDRNNTHDKTKYSLLDTVQGDLENYYSIDNLKFMTISFGLGGILANTSVDEDLQEEYQDNIRSDSTDDFSEVAKMFGEGKILIPLSIATAVTGYYLPKKCGVSAIGTWGFNTARSYFVGAPPMLLMQNVTGASRPGEKKDASNWRPFEDTNGVSGHAFMGAVPFITLAKMYKFSHVKWLFYGGSLLAGWSRVNDDDHFLSQAALGWAMAYQSVNSVFLTDEEQQENNALTFNVYPNGRNGFEFLMSYCW